MTSRLGRLGIWSLELRFGDPASAAQAAGEIDELGYGAIWIPGGVGGDILADIDRLLAATRSVTIATGVLNIWKHDPAEIGTWWKNLPADRRERVLLGLGVSHAHVVGQAFKPLSAMRDYLDRLNAAGVPGPALCLAALGPRMLELAAERTAGVHPYLVTPEHTSQARSAVGPDHLVAPEQGVALGTDPVEALERARAAYLHYKDYPNYRANWQRLGFDKAQIEAGADNLVKALFAVGTAQDVRQRLEAHFHAGADHVCLQAVTGQGLDPTAALPAWRELAELQTA